MLPRPGARGRGGTMRRTIAALQLVIVAACSSGGSGGSSAPYGTVPQLAAALQAKGVTCTSLDTSGQSELYTRESGICQGPNGDSLDLTVFTDDTNRDSWYNAAKASGGNFVLGDRWGISADHPATAQQIEQAIGGQVR